jgi:hypothetical protein
VSLPPFAEALSIGEAPHHFESHPGFGVAPKMCHIKGSIGYDPQQATRFIDEPGLGWVTKF